MSKLLNHVNQPVKTGSGPTIGKAKSVSKVDANRNSIIPSTIKLTASKVVKPGLSKVNSALQESMTQTMEKQQEEEKVEDGFSGAKNSKAAENAEMETSVKLTAQMEYIIGTPGMEEGGG